MWARAYPYGRQPIGPAAQEAGFRFILRPELPIDVANGASAHRTVALIDSGATFSFLPHEIATAIGIDPAKLAGKTANLSGIGAAVPAKFTTVTVTIVDETEPKALALPIVVPLEPPPPAIRKDGPHPVVLGRHPFMDRFRVILDQSPSPRDGVAEWTLEEI